MSTPDLFEQWRELCTEYRAAQSRCIDARERAFQNGRFTSPEQLAEINAASTAEEAVRRRMDEFIARHK